MGLKYKKKLYICSGKFFTNIGLKFIKNFSQKCSNFATEKKI